MIETACEEPQIDKSADRIRSMFSSIAHRYDRMNHVLSMNVDRYWRWKTVRQAPPIGNSPILDVCTGTGDLALAYRVATDGRIPIVATDFCSEMLEIGRRKQTQVGSVDTQGNLVFQEADTTALPFDDNEFQLVTVAFGLRNVSDTDQGLQEMARVCQPGGRVVILEFSMPTAQPLKLFYGWYFRNILPKLGQWLARNDKSAYEYLPESVGQFPQGKDMAERIEKNGLSRVEVRPLTFGVATLYIAHKE